MSHDSKYIISEFYDFKADRNLIIEAEQANKPIKLKGILQKANTQNRNGRVYPYEILKREADNYMQAVKERRALGECVPAGTQIFTEQGWKNIEDVKEGELIFTLNLEKNEYEIQSVEHTIEKFYNDDLIHVYNGSDLDFITTKKHKVIVWNEFDEYFILTAEELHEKILNKDVDLENLHIKTSDFKDIDDENYFEENLLYFHYGNEIQVKTVEIKNKIVFKTKNLKSEKVQFNDKVYCVSVPNKTWLMKYNNSISWTHNCDHPECVDNESFILTKEGWKKAPEITIEDEILTLNKENNKIEIQKPTHVTHKNYDGVMFKFSRRDVDLVVTPNHRFFIEDKNGNRFFKTAQQLYNENESGINNKSKILKEGIWECQEQEYFIIPGVNTNEFKKLPKNLKEKYSQDLKIKSDIWFAFLGIYLSEGYVTGSNGYKKRKFRVGITQKKEENKKKIRELLDCFPLLFTEYTDKNGKSDFRVSDARLHSYLLKLGNSHTKYVPYEAKNSSPYLLNILFEWFLMGDGKVGKNGRKTLFSTSERLIMDFHEVLLKIGASGTIHKEIREDRKIKDKTIKKYVNENGEEIIENIEKERIIKSENSKPIYFLHYSTTKNIYLDNRFLKIEKVEYDDLVHCVTVPNEVFYVMRNGKSHWTGNSPIVSLSNASHLITNMWWEGETLMGEVELVDTEAGNKLKGLLKSGVMLGISSRGVGSVKSVSGRDVVQNDFELIAFDFVSSPSTPGAYMFKESRQWGLKKLEDNNYKSKNLETNNNNSQNKIISLSNDNYWNL